jgi:hypothetical protein
MQQVGGKLSARVELGRGDGNEKFSALGESGGGPAVGTPNLAVNLSY